MSESDATGFSITAARAQDCEAILDLWRQADAAPSITDTTEALRLAIEHPATCVLLAEADGKLIGSIIGTFDGWRGNIYRLAVHPGYRRQGVARALLAEVERRLREAGAQRITALVVKEHREAVTFWEAVGYQSDPRMGRYVRPL